MTDIMTGGWWIRIPKDPKMWEIFLITAEAAGLRRSASLTMIDKPKCDRRCVKFASFDIIIPLYLDSSTVPCVELSFSEAYEMLQEAVKQKIIENGCNK